MTSTTTLATHYTANAITTASPGRLLTMLYDRLTRDLVAAEQALTDDDAAGAHNQLLHAQRIIMELAASLDTSAWDGAPGLASIYAFLHTELVEANVAKDTSRVAGCREIIEPLRDAWHQAGSESLASA